MLLRHFRHPQQVSVDGLANIQHGYVGCSLPVKVSAYATHSVWTLGSVQRAAPSMHTGKERPTPRTCLNDSLIASSWPWIGARCASN